MRRLAFSFAAAALLSAAVPCARADDDDPKPPLPMDQPDIRGQLDRVLAVLRADGGAIDKPCVDAMGNVHADEKTVSDLSGTISDSGRKVEGLDVARDVMQSDYEIAFNACRPNAERVCGAGEARAVRACGAMRAGNRS